MGWIEMSGTYDNRSTVTSYERGHHGFVSLHFAVLGLTACKHVECELVAMNAFSGTCASEALAASRPRTASEHCGHSGLLEAGLRHHTNGSAS